MYNEAPGIGSLLTKIRETLRGLDYSVLVVDDGSTDDTHDQIEAMASTMPIEILRHPRNRGLWETIRDGFERAAQLSGPGLAFFYSTGSQNGRWCHWHGRLERMTGVGALRRRASWSLPWRYM